MKRKWDANWKRLRVETKVDRLRDFVKYAFEKNEDSARSAHSAADTALYVANLNR